MTLFEITLITRTPSTIITRPMMAVYFSKTTSLSGLLQQIRIMPASISRCRMPPPWFMTTLPKSFFVLQVPQRPLLHEKGRRIPAALAASRMNWSGPHSITRPSR